jgi:DNA-binding HxlR family transcriptional regulator
MASKETNKMRRSYRIICPWCNKEIILLRPSEIEVLKVVDDGLRSKTFTEIIRKTGLSPPALSEALSFLVENKFLRKNDNGYETTGRMWME